MQHRVDKPRNQERDIGIVSPLRKSSVKTLREKENLSQNYAGISKYRKIVILTDGCADPLQAKTAISLLRYRTDDIVGVLDASQSGKTANTVFGVGGEIPITRSLSETPLADALFLGTAPAGGQLPQAWWPIIHEAISRELDIVSGLHDSLLENEELVSAAEAAKCNLVDVRRNNYRKIATAATFNPECLRILTVGQDCSVGKMTVALEIEQQLKTQGHDAQFLATGQTGIMIRGAGIPADGIVADFMSGAVEELVLAHQEHEIVLVEGQGSLVHPSFSGVTLAILHGCAPHGMILCYEVGRESLKGFPTIPMTSLQSQKHLFEINGAVRNPCKVIGVAMNSRNVSPERADEEKKRVESELDLPVCDVFRHGPQALVDAVLDLKFRLAPFSQKTNVNGLSTSSKAIT